MTISKNTIDAFAQIYFGKSPLQIIQDIHFEKIDHVTIHPNPLFQIENQQIETPEKEIQIAIHSNPLFEIPIRKFEPLSNEDWIDLFGISPSPPKK